MKMLLKIKDVYGNEAGVQQVEVLGFTSVNNVLVGVYADETGMIKGTSIENLQKEMTNVRDERVDAAAVTDNGDNRAARPSGSKPKKS